MTPAGIGATLLLDVSRYGYAALALGVLLENAGVPVPGETMLLAASALAARGRLSIALVIVTAAAAAIAGDNIGFMIGRLGGRPALERFGRWVFITPERLEAIDAFFSKRGPAAVFFARFVPAIRVIAALVAGSSAITWRTFSIYNALGALAWALGVGALGFAGTDAVAGALPWLRAAHLGAWTLLAAALAALAVHVAREVAHARRARGVRRRQR